MDNEGPGGRERKSQISLAVIDPDSHLSEPESGQAIMAGQWGLRDDNESVNEGNESVLIGNHNL